MAQSRTPGEPSSLHPLSTETDRTHCPPDKEVQAVAQGAPPSEAFEQHLAECLACRREFQDHRVQGEWERFYQKAKWLLYAVLLIILGSIVFRASRDGFGW